MPTSPKLLKDARRLAIYYGHDLRRFGVVIPMNDGLLSHVRVASEGRARTDRGALGALCEDKLGKKSADEPDGIQRVACDRRVSPEARYYENGAIG
jgi:hypothetical protein